MIHVIPTNEDIMLPILEICSDSEGHRLVDLANVLADRLNLTDEQRNMKLDSGQTVIYNRTTWAAFKLKKAGMLVHRNREYFISEDGKNMLLRKPDRIDSRFLKEITESSREGIEDKPITYEMLESRANEALTSTYEATRAIKEHYLLERVKEIDPYFFERIVGDLMKKMGYGEYRVTQKSNDGGIDCIVKQDKLGIDDIYLQAKRWKETVPLDCVKSFAGTLMGKRSKKGVMITTSKFSKKAYDYINTIDAKIILIEGKKLAEYMYEYNVGVAEKMRYSIKNYDNLYFDDE